MKDSEIAEKLFRWLDRTIGISDEWTTKEYEQDKIAELEDIIREIRQAK
jgi:hypothetical protein